MAERTFEYSKTAEEHLKTISECGFSEPEGHQFAGWTFTQNGEDFVSDPHLFSADTSVYAKWSKKTYNVTTENVNCSLTCASTGTFLEKLNIRWTPNTYTGNTFYFGSISIYAGRDASGELLYKNTQDDHQVDYTMITRYYPDIFVNVIYTKTIATYDVTLNTNGGTINAGSIDSYTYGNGAVLPTDVTRNPGESFAGWYDNSSLTGDGILVIGSTETGDKTFWAKWNMG